MAPAAMNDAGRRLTQPRESMSTSSWRKDERSIGSDEVACAPNITFKVGRLPSWDVISTAQCSNEAELRRQLNRWKIAMANTRRASTGAAASAAAASTCTKSRQGVACGTATAIAGNDATA
eukprot:scaffold3308_cov97-Skeletonema_dohrnii-CCMP3373.AAC.3